VTPYYADESVTLYLGDALAVLSTLAAESVDCVVTSPPYFGLRDYGVEGQHGLEASPAEYVEVERRIHAETRRVLRNDGTFWLNLGDSYYSGRGNPGVNSTDEKQPARRGWVRPQDRCGVAWSTPKNLLGIPWRVAFALQDDGWTLRNEVIWHKPNAMPESVTDRLSSRHEHLFMFSKSRRYWFDLDPLREPHAEVSVKRAAPHRADPGKSAREGLPYLGVGGAQTLALSQMNHPGGRNPGDVWSIPTQP
jgi:site-specific DNA-methyltransferase (cytosine-N4-specific)